MAKVERGDKQKMTCEERRQAILQAAMRLFAERGFRGTTTRALAAAVGVTEPVLYAHFRSKRQLYRAMIEAVAGEGLGQASELLKPSDQPRGDREVLCELAELILSRHRRNPAFFRLMWHLALDGGELAKLFYRSQVLASRELLADYFRKRSEAGVLRVVDPDLAARAFLSMVVNFSVSILMFHEPHTPDERRGVTEGLVELFLNGVMRPLDAAPI